jgi:hypothetical protein
MSWTYVGGGRGAVLVWNGAQLAADIFIKYGINSEQLFQFSFLILGEGVEGGGAIFHLKGQCHQDCG